MVSGRFWAFSFDMSGFVLAAVSFTANRSKSRCLSLPGTKSAVLLRRFLSCSEDGARERYSIICCTFFFLLTIVVPMAAPPLTNNRAIHKTRLLCVTGLGKWGIVFQLRRWCGFFFSFVPSFSLKYLPQPSQYQYSILPSVVWSPPLPGSAFKLVWFFGSKARRIRRRRPAETALACRWPCRRGNPRFPYGWCHAYRFGCGSFSSLFCVQAPQS